MASCGLQIDEEILNMNSPEMQALKNSLKDENAKMGMQKMLKALMTMVPENMEDQLVSTVYTSLAVDNDDAREMVLAEMKKKNSVL